MEQFSCSNEQRQSEDFQKSSPRDMLEDASPNQQSRQKRGEHGPSIKR
jgi:hypothetical protein